MGSAKVKYVIEDKGEHFVIFRGKQRTLMSAVVWNSNIAEAVCAALNKMEGGVNVPPTRPAVKLPDELAVLDHTIGHCGKCDFVKETHDYKLVKKAYDFIVRQLQA
jgi:hypothetical protein